MMQRSTAFLTRSSGWKSACHGNAFSSATTEADIRLFTTPIRFDAVHYRHFKCNRQPLVAHPSLWTYTRELYQHPDIQPTVNIQHFKRHYYGSHRWINPSGIIPTGPDIDFDAPSSRYSRNGER
jgi:putative glutathione S-transferase